MVRQFFFHKQNDCLKEFYLKCAAQESKFQIIKDMYWDLALLMDCYGNNIPSIVFNHLSIGYPENKYFHSLVNATKKKLAKFAMMEIDDSHFKILKVKDMRLELGKALESQSHETR
jgi:hypothetical protein